MVFVAWVIIIVAMYLGLLGWGAYIDRVYFSTGSPGHRPLMDMYSDNGWIFTFPTDYYEDRPA